MPPAARNVLDFRCVRERGRAPLLTLELERALLKFKYATPALDVLL